MSSAALFVVGLLVTLTVGAAIALLVYAAILDGRDARAKRAAEHDLKRPLAEGPWLSGRQQVSAQAAPASTSEGES
jgi:hypothetical protein